MNELKIEISGDRSAFEPGDEINGRVTWMLDTAPRRVELRLFWFTRGKGTEDAHVEDSIQFEPPIISDSQAFRFRLPVSPYSFSGTLISLVWALELVAQPSKVVTRKEIAVAPGGQEVLLGSLPADKTRKQWFKWSRR